MKQRQNSLGYGGETGAQGVRTLGQACTVSHRWSLVESPGVLLTHLYTTFPLMTSSRYFTWARGILEVGETLGTLSSSEVVVWELARLVQGGGGGWPAFAPFPFLQKGPSSASPGCDMSQGEGKALGDLRMKFRLQGSSGPLSDYSGSHKLCSYSCTSTASHGESPGCTLIMW